MPSTLISLRVPDDVLARIRREAAQKGVTVSYLLIKPWLITKAGGLQVGPSKPAPGARLDKTTIGRRPK